MDNLKKPICAALIFIIIIILVFAASCNSISNISQNDYDVKPDGYIPAGEYPGCLDSVQFLQNESQQANRQSSNGRTTPHIIKGVWVSYYSLQIKGYNEQEYEAYINEMFSSISNYGINTVFFHVRPYGDALYKSDIFPWSHILTGTQGKDPGYDPLEIAVKCAHSHGLSIQAWVNPYRVQISSGDSVIPAMLSESNPINSDDGMLIKYDGEIWYNPASEKAKKLITDGIYEIISRYDVDGVQFDDYFYPTDDAGIDSSDYAEYTASGGTLTLSQWRRDNVSSLIKQCHDIIKQYDNGLLFGISPSADITKNMNELYADVKLWTSQSGYIDYICPQIYFGFDNDSLPFESTLSDWISLIKSSDIKLCIGLAGYKTGEFDKYAGSGGDEWQNGGDIIKREAEIVLSNNSLWGICIFDSEFITQPDNEISKKEHEALKQYLNGSDT